MNNEEIITKIPGKIEKFTSDQGTYRHENGKIIFIRKSKAHYQNVTTMYWYGIIKDKFESYAPENLIIILACGSIDRLLVMPGRIMANYLEYTNTAKDGAWKFHILKEGSYFEIRVPGKEKQNVTDFLNKFNLITESVPYTQTEDETWSKSKKIKEIKEIRKPIKSDSVLREKCGILAEVINQIIPIYTKKDTSKNQKRFLETVIGAAIWYMGKSAGINRISVKALEDYHPESGIQNPHLTEEHEYPRKISAMELLNMNPGDLDSEKMHYLFIKKYGRINYVTKKENGLLRRFQKDGVFNNPADAYKEAGIVLLEVNGNELKLVKKRDKDTIERILKRTSQPPIIQLSTNDVRTDYYPDNLEDEPLKILKLRYAKGEITKEQFEQMKKDLSD